MSTQELCVAKDLASSQKVVLGWQETAWERLFPPDAKSRPCEEIVYWGNASNGDIGVSFPHLEECTLTGSRIIQASVRPCLT